MADTINPNTEPRGFGEHTRGLSGEYAHEQGWQLNEEERTRLPQGKQNTDGGTKYEYGARDFGDEPIDASLATGADIDDQQIEEARRALRRSANHGTSAER